MRQQQTLPLAGDEPLRVLWRECPEGEREEAVEMFSRLLAQAVHGIVEKENNHDDGKD